MTPDKTILPERTSTPSREVIPSIVCQSNSSVDKFTNNKAANIILFFDCLLMINTC